MKIDKKQFNTANKYAKAFFKIAKDFDCAEKFYDDLKSILEVFKNSPDLKDYLNNDLISKNDKKEVVFKVFQHDLDIQTINLLNVLIDNNRVNIIETLTACYEKIYEDDKNFERVGIISAVQMNEASKNRIKEKLEAKLNKKIIPDYKINTDIIGGFIVEYQGKTLDLSIKTKLKDMEKQLIKG